LTEFLIFLLVVSLIGMLDLAMTKVLLQWGNPPGSLKILATGVGLLFNFLGRRFLVFPEPPSGPWEPHCGASFLQQQPSVARLALGIAGETY